MDSWTKAEIHAFTELGTGINGGWGEGVWARVMDKA